MQIKKIHLSVLYLVLNKYLSHFKFQIKYYENLHNPEFKEVYGYTITEAFTRALNTYEHELQNVKDLRLYSDKNNLEGINVVTKYLNEYEFFFAVKLCIKELMLQANDFKHNKFLVLSNYKKVVILLDLLKLNKPEYNIVTARFFFKG